MKKSVGGFRNTVKVLRSETVDVECHQHFHSFLFSLYLISGPLQISSMPTILLFKLNDNVPQPGWFQDMTSAMRLRGTLIPLIGIGVLYGHCRLCIVAGMPPVPNGFLLIPPHGLI